MPLTLHGHPQSSSTRRVLLILHEKKIPYDQNGFSFTPSPRYPTSKTTGFILYECRAIARYLVAAYPNDGPALVPAAGAGVKAHAIFEQAMSVEAFNFEPIVGGILWERLYKQFAGLTPDEAQVSMLSEKLETKLDGYERILANSRYLAGDDLTLADLFHVPYITLFGAGNIDVLSNEEKAQKWPHVVRWANELLQRDASKSI
ncbi:Glutathione S-transferase [Mycena sanguinolenta]|uniref:glutathione transferase n=1 Tax=Mycena sanguinolenta TaxID=230812 RepID=A0A8H6YSI8_9AGAR|nr:Glutathione S-transferase [Mycena sanguinolenta]